MTLHPVTLHDLATAEALRDAYDAAWRPAFRADELNQRKNRTMTASIHRLHVLSYAAGYTAWLYKATATPIGDMDQPGFFSAMADMVQYGDTITCIGVDGVAMRYVARCTSGSVVVGVMR